MASLPSTAGATRRRRGRTTRQNAILSTVSTVAFFAVVAVAVALSPGASKVVDAFFSVSGLKDRFSTVVAGFWINVKLMLIAEALVPVFATRRRCCGSRTCASASATTRSCVASTSTSPHTRSPA
jgi:hypothetical protein